VLGCATNGVFNGIFINNVADASHFKHMPHNNYFKYLNAVCCFLEAAYANYISIIQNEVVCLLYLTITAPRNNLYALF